MAKLMNYPNQRFVQREIVRWLDTVPDGVQRHPFHLLDLLYWEQRMGNWGAMFQAEGDVAIEEVCPFNNRNLLATLLNTPRQLRLKPNYPLYRDLIARMWPELLEFPFNPVPLQERVRRTARSGIRFLKRSLPRLR